MNHQIIWQVWTISKQEIEQTARALDMDPAELTDQDYERIVHQFTKCADNQDSNWPLMLVKVLLDIRSEKRPRRTARGNGITNQEARQGLRG